MYLSLNLLKEYVDLPKSLSPEEIGSALTMHTVEVEGIKKQSEKFENVVVGKILEIRQHPNADRLRLAKVDIGTEVLDIVCGAPNIEVGQLVPVALVGAELPNGLVIKEAEVRGEISRGMLCAEDELGLGEDHSGIIILGKRAKIGQLFSDYLGLIDTVLEVDNKSLSNRPDLWGHIGIARELSAIFGVKFNKIKLKAPKFNSTIDSSLKVKIEDTILCPRYMAAVVNGIKVAPSPSWMQEKLIVAGHKPINNIVDITNFVMIELGQPMHAFDNDKVEGITVRKAKNNEEIVTLDGEKRKLTADDLLVTDGQNPLAIAGVIGGQGSSINDDTVSVVFEAANFDYVNIRKTSSRLNLRTESSVRFEKGLDPNLAEIAIARAIELVKKICKNAEPVGELIDEKNFELNLGPLEIDIDWINKIIGERIDEIRVYDILDKLGFEIVNNSSRQKKDKFAKKSEEKKIIVKIPSWRATRDVAIKEDIAEEIVRIYGYNNIKSSMPDSRLEAPKQDKLMILERKIRACLIGAPALSEVYNYSFVGEKQLKKLGLNTDDYLRISNPIASHQTLLRQNLTPNLLENVKLNQARYDKIRIFEIGRVFLNIDGNLRKDIRISESLPYQEKRLGIVCAGKSREEIFSEVKGIVEYLFSDFNIQPLFKKSDDCGAWSDKNFNSQIIVNGKSIGVLFLVDKIVSKNIGLKKEVTVAEIRIDDILKVMENTEIKTYKPFEKFPALTRDLAFVINSKILYNDIKGEIEKFSELISRVELFDIYEGDKLGKGKKSLAFHIFYQAGRTLTSSEVDEVQTKLIKNLKEKFDANIRDF